MRSMYSVHSRSSRSSEVDRLHLAFEKKMQDKEDIIRKGNEQTMNETKRKYEGTIKELQDIVTFVKVEESRVLGLAEEERKDLGI